MYRTRYCKVKDCSLLDRLRKILGATSALNATKKDHFVLYKRMGVSHYFFSFKISGHLEVGQDINISYQVKPCIDVLFCAAFFFLCFVYACFCFILDKINMHFALMALVLNVVFDLCVVSQAYSCVRWFREYIEKIGDSIGQGDGSLP